MGILVVVMIVGCTGCDYLEDYLPESLLEIISGILPDETPDNQDQVPNTPEYPDHVHKIVIVKGYEPTCTTDGLTYGKHCEICGKITVEQQVVPATGHTEKNYGGKNATCTTDGSTVGKRCVECGEITVESTTIPATGHTEVTYNAKAPSCTETGWESYVICSMCDYTTFKEIPALGHNYGDWIVVQEGNCEVEGYKYQTCSNCFISNEAYTSAGHDDPYGVCYTCNKVTDEDLAIDTYLNISTNAFSSYFTTYYDGSLYVKYNFHDYEINISMSNTYDGKIFIYVQLYLLAEIIDYSWLYSGSGFVGYNVYMNDYSIRSGYVSVSSNIASISWSSTLASIDFVDFTLYLSNYRM